MTSTERILVIKLGALGDVVQAFGPFQAIRAHHPGAKVTLLTTEPYRDLTETTGWFDQVWVDERPKALEIGKWRRLRKRLNGGGFSRVYDLQTSDRSSFYYRLFKAPKPEWSGIAKACSHPHANPDRDLMHTVERQAQQLHMAGIGEVAPPSLNWADADGLLERLELRAPFVLLAPGGAAHRPGKRWPHFAALARSLAAEGITPVVLGTDADADVLGAVTEACPETRNLMGRTRLLDLVPLARAARGAVGNDTGPMHLIALAGCPSVVLFSHDSDPALCGQRGPKVQILRAPDLADLEPERVRAALDALTGT